MKLRLWHILLLIPFYLAFAVWSVQELWAWEAAGGTHRMPTLLWWVYDLAGKPGVFAALASPGVVLVVVVVRWWRDPFRAPAFRWERKRKRKGPTIGGRISR